MALSGKSKTSASYIEKVIVIVRGLGITLKKERRIGAGTFDLCGLSGLIDIHSCYIWLNCLLGGLQSVIVRQPSLREFFFLIYLHF